MPDLISHITRQLHAVATMREIARDANLLDTITDVQDWQCQRILATHQEMLHQPRFAPALHFFVDHVYGPQDFSQRDQDIGRLVPKLGKYLPASALVSLGDALQLNALSFELDYALARNLKSQTIDRQLYAGAYLNCDNQPQRQTQLQLMQALGNHLADAVATKGISTLLMLSRRPAKKAGLGVLHQFMSSGHKAFKHLGKADDFILPIVQREQQLMTALFDPAEDNPLPMIPLYTPALEV